MKRDGRTLDHQTLEDMRLTAMQRMDEGEPPAAVAASFGLHRSWAFKCRAAVRESGRGPDVLHSHQATGRPRKLTSTQERQIFRWANGKNPMQYGFKFLLWTRQIVQALVWSRFRVQLSLASVGALLQRLKLTERKPLQLAGRRNPAAMERWRREHYPAIARQAKEDGADIYFWNESGPRTDPEHRQSMAVQEPGRRRGVSAASAVSAKGAFWFTTYKGGLNDALFVKLLKKLCARREQPLQLVVDGIPAYKTKVVAQYVESTNGMLTLHYLPASDQPARSRTKRPDHAQ
jgi:transposase